MEETGFEDGLIEDSMVANKLGLSMWSTDKIHMEKLVYQLSAMEHRPHANPVIVAKGHMQYRWFGSKMKEQ